MPGEKGAVMTTLDDVAKKKAAEQSAEQKAAVELVRLFQVELEHYEKIEGTTLSMDGKANRLAALIRAMGANVEDMDAAHHDLVLAVTSHTPHLIAYTMVGVADHLKRVTESEVIKYSAAGFRDFTRIAA